MQNDCHPDRCLNLNKILLSFAKANTSFLPECNRHQRFVPEPNKSGRPVRRDRMAKAFLGGVFWHQAVMPEGTSKHSELHHA